MKALRQNENAIIMCIIEVVAGILLLVNPVGLTASIIIAAGIALMVDSLFNVIRYFTSNPGEAAVSQLLMRGLISLLAGAFCTFNPQWFIITFPVIAILYGVAVLIGGLGKVQMAVVFHSAVPLVVGCVIAYLVNILAADLQALAAERCRPSGYQQFPDRNDYRSSSQAGRTVYLVC